MITKGNKPGKLFKGNYQPIDLHYNNQKMAGWKYQTKSNPAIWSNTYDDDFKSIVILGNGKQSGTPSVSSPVQMVASTGKLRICGKNLFYPKTTDKGDIGANCTNVVLSDGGRTAEATGKPSATKPGQSVYSSGYIRFRFYTQANTNYNVCVDIQPQSEKTADFISPRMLYFNDHSMQIADNKSHHITNLNFWPGTDGLNYFIVTANSQRVKVSNLMITLGGSSADFETYEQGFEGTIITLPTLRQIPNTNVRDKLEYTGDGNWKLTRNVGVISSYAGENINNTILSSVDSDLLTAIDSKTLKSIEEESSSIWCSSTGELSTGATVWYQLGTPTVETLDLGEVRTLPNYTSLVTESTYPPTITATVKVADEYYTNLANTTDTDYMLRAKCLYAALEKYLGGWDVTDEGSDLWEAFDVNGDGKVDKLDLLRLNKYIASWDVEISSYTQAYLTDTTKEIPGWTIDKAGWQTGYTIDSSTKSIVASTNRTVTNAIPITKLDVIRVRGLPYSNANTSLFYWTQLDLTTHTRFDYLGPGATNARFTVEYKNSEYIITITNTSCRKDIFIRFAFDTPADSNNIVITRNEEIVDLQYEDLVCTARDQKKITETNVKNRSVYNDIGYRRGYYATTNSPYEEPESRTTLIGLIPFTKNTTLYIKNLRFTGTWVSRIIAFNQYGSQLPQIKWTGVSENNKVPTVGTFTKLSEYYYKFVPNPTFWGDDCAYCTMSAATVEGLVPIVSYTEIKKNKSK